MQSPLSIKNIKISLFVQSNLAPCNIKTQFNAHKLAFRVYSTSPQRVNVTGLRSYQEMLDVQQRLKSANVFSHIHHMTIDSIFASRKLPAPVYFNMDAVYQHAKNIVPRHKYSVYYNAEEGSKCLLLPKVQHKKTKKINLKKLFKRQSIQRPPQITLFHTGSVTVMGLKSLSQIDHVNQLICRILKDELQLKQQSG